jgi:serine/threonine kinase PknH
VMYFCLTGQYPFPDGTAVEKMMCHQHKQPTSIKSLVPDAPDDLVQIIEKLMQKNPTDRYVKTAEVIEVLQAFNAGAPAPRKPSGQMPKPPLPKPAAAPPNGAAEPAVGPGAVRVPRPAAPLPKQAAPPKPAPIPRVAAAAKEAKAAPAPPVAVPAAAAAAQEAPATEPAPQAPQAGVMQRLGPIGIILLAVMAGAIAWLVSSFIK